ncbi:MAG: hypothetical protein V2B15_03600 [Bacteroidota bacterium]
MGYIIDDLKLKDYSLPETDSPELDRVSNSEVDLEKENEEPTEDLIASTEIGRDYPNFNYMEELIKTRGFINNEGWEKTININSRILHRGDKKVICECLIDKENKRFERMSFPSNIFSHLDKSIKNPYVMLSISSKPGSTRIDVLKGDGLVDIEAFKLKDKWEKLEGDNFNQPHDKPIEL